jgi:hypothetical protein
VLTANVPRFAIGNSPILHTLGRDDGAVEIELDLIGG